MLTRLFNTKRKYNFYIKVKRFFYDSTTKYDTIFAPATSIDLTKGSPLAVIRVSGDETGRVLSHLTRYSVPQRDVTNTSALFKKGRLIEARQATITKIIRPDTEELIDLGLVLWFPKPNSYTGEDVCEFHLHGSQAVIKSMLDYLGTMNGLRPAEAGEFTRRAVLNGKMSLLQAESLPDLIASKTDNQRRLALKGLDGATLSKYNSWIASLVNILAHLEASIDFGEDELIGEQEVVHNCITKLRQLSDEMNQFIRVSSHCREVIQAGIRAAILGKPNSGKSTFMNVLCRRDRSIVSDLSGTTRDVVEHAFDLGGNAITLCDTAGLKDINPNLQANSSEKTVLEKHESVEREGIKRALDAAREAHLIFYLIDGKELIGCEEDKRNIIEELENVLLVLGDDRKLKMLYLVINKMDLNEKLTNNSLLESIGNLKLTSNQEVKIFFISCKSELNLDKLVSQLSNCLDEFAGANVHSPHDIADRLSLSEDGCQQRWKHVSQQVDYVNERHLSLLNSTHRHLHEASQLNLTTIDEMAQHVRESVDYLSRIVGSVSNDDVIDVIFRDFCIGK